MTIAPGGTSFDHQLFFGDDGIYARRWNGNATNWGASVWNKFLTAEDIHGTLNHVAKFTSANGLGDSQIWDDANGVAINVNSVSPGFRFDVNGNTKIRGNELLTGTLTVGGASTLNNTLQVTGATTIGGLVTVNNNANVTGATTISGLLTVNNNAGITNNANIGGNANISVNANVGGALDVNGTSHLNGKVAIGTTYTPGTHALYVGGSIIATEVKVALQASWPDYVFDEKTAAPDPMAWDQYIKANKHLPGIPSAQEVTQNGGFELGENQRLLLEKVEQLTLMLIEQQKQIETLKAAVNSCKE
jgi:carbonic anhydrase/acetyltransferase-like protein (isoleucine patch superfamily)